MTAEFNSGAWDTDDLLVKSLELKDKFYWQSHTLSHLSRDNLGQSDCDTEDGGKACTALSVKFYVVTISTSTPLSLMRRT